VLQCVLQGVLQGVAECCSGDIGRRKKLFRRQAAGYSIYIFIYIYTHVHISDSLNAHAVTHSSHACDTSVTNTRAEHNTYVYIHIL